MTEADIRADERAMVEAEVGITDAIQRAQVWIDYARALRDRPDSETYRHYERTNREELAAKLHALGPVSGSIGEG